MAFTLKKSITVDHTLCGASDSSNFPVLVAANLTTIPIGDGDAG